ncbi:alanine dehydrogenase [Paenibacillus protaetiae]|uniref:Alanine dehydrogenase n=1 Tax=Paenibacillus protaetiae TaxID=2509456 RepID=A0A4P6F1L9_9BACL|nr:alanine dehydrogenase [Paenibacillus protaetiae]QAY68019.1 alanine dehydrogenase [Paenibacillus protaetiae]
MKIGVPKEIKNNENRVALTPAGAKSMVLNGHTVYVEAGAGAGSGFADAEYKAAGAALLEQAGEVWAAADMIMKVKEPIASEYSLFRNGLLLFTYLHLAAEPELTKALVQSGVTAIAYETVLDGGSLPLLTPMSEVAGRMAVQVGAQLLEKHNGGKGILLSGIPGVTRGKTVIIGGGVVGTNAAKIAVGMGADVTIIDSNLARLRQLEDMFGRDIHTLASSPASIAEASAEADLLIGAVLIPGAKAPKLVTEPMVRAMRPGSVIVDVAVDQGGIVETIDHTTTHDNPTYVKHGVVHYAVANMPGAVPRTSTLGLTNATLPYALQLARLGAREALSASPALRSGTNTAAGYVTYEAVAKDLGYPYMPVEQALALL